MVSPLYTAPEPTVSLEPQYSLMVKPTKQFKPPQVTDN